MSAEIVLLEPVTRSLCKALLARWEEEMHPPLRVTHTLRTNDEQLHLYQQGRVLDNGIWRVRDAKLIVTKAKPGESAHNYGAAFDVCFIGIDPYLHQYEVEHGVPDPLWSRLGEVGVKVGLEWGGSWTTLKDRPHFERPNWKSLKSTP